MGSDTVGNEPAIFCVLDELTLVLLDVLLGVEFVDHDVLPFLGVCVMTYVRR